MCLLRQLDLGPPGLAGPCRAPGPVPSLASALARRRGSRFLRWSRYADAVLCDRRSRRRQLDGRCQGHCCATHPWSTMAPVPAGLGQKLPSRTFSVTGCCRCVCVPGGGADSEVDRRTVIFTTTIKKPVIAAINGPVAGIGLAFALAWCAPCPPLGVRAAHPSTRASRAHTSRRVTA